MCPAVTKVQLDSATIIHRAALDCLLFTQPLPEPYKALLFSPNMPATTE